MPVWADGAWPTLSNTIRGGHPGAKRGVRRLLAGANDCLGAADCVGEQ
jgi:hypothetical protein